MKQYFIASVSDDYVDTIEDIADRLRNKGCEIKQVLRLTGVITGNTDKRTNLNDLKIEGIAAIEKQRTVRKKKFGSKRLSK